MDKIMETCIEEEIMPFLQSHGGQMEIISFAEDVLTIRFKGACAGCPGADLGTKQFIEEALTEKMERPIKVDVESSIDPDMWDFAKKLLNKEIR